MFAKLAVQSKVWEYSCLSAGIAGSNPAGSMGACLLWVLCVVKGDKPITYPRGSTEFGTSECDQGTSKVLGPLGLSNHEKKCTLTKIISLDKLN